MVKMRAECLDELTVRCTHENGAEITTFPPGFLKGVDKKLFSPTDLFAASLGMCVLTMMSIKAEKLKIDIKGTSVDVTKEMHTTPPYAAKSFKIAVCSPHTFEPNITDQLVAFGKACPVHHSIHPDIDVDLSFTWGCDEV